MRSIKLESKINTQNLLDIDNFRSRYLDYDTYLNLYVTFPGFDLVTLDKNICYLYNNCTLFEFKNSWYMRPDYASYDLYNTVIYWPILLYINNIDIIENFRGISEILAPSYTAILEISRDRVAKNEVIDVTKKKGPFNKNMYYKRYPFDKIELDIIKGTKYLGEEPEIEDECVLKETEEIFVLTEEDITNKYILITYQPANTGSVFLYLDDLNIPQAFGYDYVLKPDSVAEYKKISWAKDDCQFGNGMEELLEPGHKIRVKYVYAETGCMYCPPLYTILDGGIID